MIIESSLGYSDPTGLCVGLAEHRKLNWCKAFLEFSIAKVLLT
jgi:hypothetical protein